MTKPVFVIAEAGVNHNGSMDLALELVDAARQAGADAVKFQTFKASKLTTGSAPKASYQEHTTGTTQSQQEMLKALEFTPEMHDKVMAHCAKQGIAFLSSPFDAESASYLTTLGLRTMKIPSGEITNLPYLRALGGLGCDLIISTGMSDLAEIGRALDILTHAGTPLERVTVLHCNTQYPTPYADVNLRAMETIRKEYGVAVGYSDHSPGIEVPIAAVALGAVMIEKHFTMDRNLEGPDHQASLLPVELTQMVRSIRNIEAALGTTEKKPTDSETPNIAIARKSIVASRPIAQGEVFSAENLTTKRPGNGLSPMHWDELIGEPSSKSYAADELIEGV